MYASYYVINIQRPSQQPESRSLNQPVVTIGRQAGDIPLGDPLSSGRHAEIYFQNGQVYVRDVGSTNGTYFNGVRMPEFALAPGQSFQCGQTAGLFDRARLRAGSPRAGRSPAVG